jgi:hypothetical protein
MEGNSLTPKYLYPIAPNNTMANDITVANTGLLILTLDKLIFLFIDLEI